MSYASKNIRMVLTAKLMILLRSITSHRVTMFLLCGGNFIWQASHGPINKYDDKSSLMAEHLRVFPWAFVNKVASFSADKSAYRASQAGVQIEDLKVQLQTTFHFLRVFDLSLYSFHTYLCFLEILTTHRSF